MPDIRLVDLEVIKRFSLAVRADAVPAEELLEALDADRALVMQAMRPKAAHRIPHMTGVALFRLRRKPKGGRHSPTRNLEMFLRSSMDEGRRSRPLFLRPLQKGAAAIARAELTRRSSA